MTEESKQGAIAVTGASKGIGAAIALELARRGFRVACLTRAGKGIEEFEVPGELAARMRNETCDVLDEAAVARALKAVAQWGGDIGGGGSGGGGNAGGGLRGVVNNAGVHIIGPSEQLATSALEAVLATNVTGLFIVSREAFPYLKAGGGGTIVNLGSYFERMGVPRNMAYTASKAAVGAITRCLAVEWAGHGIRVLNVAPGYIETDLNREFLTQPVVREKLLPRIPLGRAGTTDEVARLVASLFSEDIPYLTGETLYLDGGHGIAH